MNGIGRLLIIAGIGLIVIGGILILLGRIPGLSVGKLPGDLSWENGDVRFFAPIGMMLLISIILTILLNVIFRLFR
jgi:hypothetical protein